MTWSLIEGIWNALQQEKFVCRYFISTSCPKTDTMLLPWLHYAAAVMISSFYIGKTLHCNFVTFCRYAHVCLSNIVVRHIKLKRRNTELLAETIVLISFCYVQTPWNWEFSEWIKIALSRRFALSSFQISWMIKCFTYSENQSLVLLFLY